MYKHRIVQGIADLADMLGGKGGDPMMRALWMGLKGQVPGILRSLDESPELVAEIEAKIRAVLEEPVVEFEAQGLRIDVQIDPSAWTMHKDGELSLRLPRETWALLLPNYEPPGKTEESGQ